MEEYFNTFTQRVTKWLDLIVFIRQEKKKDNGIIEIDGKVQDYFEYLQKIENQTIYMFKANQGYQMSTEKTNLQHLDQIFLKIF